jgi:rubrerythrin
MYMERNEFLCKHCGHVWLSKIEPKVCPRCHNDWRKPRTQNATTNRTI